MNLLGYTLANEDKINRAILGTVQKGGALSGGVGENALDEVKLAEYDKLGGLILKGKYKVKTGSFYNFEKKAPREKPEVFLELRDLLGNVVVIAEGEDIPLEVKAVEIVEEKKKKIKKVKLEE